MSKYRDIIDKLKKQVNISQSRLITLQVACPIEYVDGSIDAVPLELSEEDKAARTALREALGITDADLVVEIQRFCPKEDYAALLQGGLPKVLGIGPLV